MPLSRSDYSTVLKKQYDARRAQRVKDRNKSTKALCKPVQHALTATMVGGTTGSVSAKRGYIRSKALLAAVRTLPCQVTGRTDGVEAAHSNWPQHGKGKSVKADDNRVAALCRDIHRELDQGTRWSAEQRQRLWWDAHVATVRALIAAGKWPKAVPVPSLEDFWA